MDKTITYLNLLEDSMMKKKNVLLKLTTLTEEQSILFEKKDLNSERQDEILKEKQLLIEDLNQLDDGFETVYSQIASVLKNNKNTYQTQIKKLQVLISEITDLSVKLQAQEIKNKDKFTQYLKKQRQEICQARQGSRTSAKYYQNMANQHQMEQTYFLDEKK